MARSNKITRQEWAELEPPRFQNCNGVRIPYLGNLICNHKAVYGLCKRWRVDKVEIEFFDGQGNRIDLDSESGGIKIARGARSRYFPYLMPSIPRKFFPKGNDGSRAFSRVMLQMQEDCNSGGSVNTAQALKKFVDYSKRSAHVRIPEKVVSTQCDHEMESLERTQILDSSDNTEHEQPAQQLQSRVIVTDRNRSQSRPIRRLTEPTFKSCSLGAGVSNAYDEAGLLHDPRKCNALRKQQILSKARIEEADKIAKERREQAIQCETYLQTLDERTQKMNEEAQRLNQEADRAEMELRTMRYDHRKILGARVFRYARSTFLEDVLDDPRVAPERMQAYSLLNDLADVIHRHYWDCDRSIGGTSDTSGESESERDEDMEGNEQ